MPLLAAVTFGVIEAISELRGAGPGIRATRYERRDNIYLRQRHVSQPSHMVSVYFYMHKSLLLIHFIPLGFCLFCVCKLDLIFLVFQTSGSEVTLAPISVCWVH